MSRIPVATYRLQFNAGFTFRDAERIVPYLASLGITDIYASPILRARKGSNHGYDVVDATMLNPELGTEDDFTALNGELQRIGLGLLVDIVPNHMAASHENIWWTSVLENGIQSRFFHYFDIERSHNKLLLPILGRPYGEALESGEITLAFDSDGLFFSYYEKRLPLAPDSYRAVLRGAIEGLPTEGVAIELRDLVESEEAVANSRFLKETIWRIYEQSEDFRNALAETIKRVNGTPGDVDSFNDLDQLLDAQHYRLAYWRIASEKINYRRFFDVADLVGVRVENPEVFEARLRRHLELIGEGKITGLRIDHIDGLHDPAAYLTKLRHRAGEEQYVIVEKILAHDEDLPDNFAVAGTTGYDFVDTLNALFLDPDGLGRLDDLYRSFTGTTKSFDDICYERKKQVISELFPGEMRGLGKRLGELSLRDRNARDFAPAELLVALTEITACMGVYRTYIREVRPSEADRQRIRRAIAEARGRAGATVDPRVFRFVELVLLLEPPSYLEGERDAWLAFVMRWQQFTGRVMAKGVEDTAFYNYHRLVSLNEVGGHPGLAGAFDPVEEFHRRNERILAHWPDTLNATSTHDTKRSEDVRARIHVLSEIADEWAAHVTLWSHANARFRSDGLLDSNTELFLYQTLIGMWPLDRSDIRERLDQYLEKAAREAKTHTSWIDPNPAYETALKSFAHGILENREFCQSFEVLQKRVAWHGCLNALAQVVLKTTAPGIPDFYQGTELWDLSVVDPDNRRPVDYSLRAAMLRDLPNNCLDLLGTWQDGRVKLFVTRRALEVRSRHFATFARGAYKALRVDSPNICAFARGDDVVVAVRRLTTRPADPIRLPVGGRWKEAFTGEVVEDEFITLDDVFPVAIFERY